MRSQISKTSLYDFIIIGAGINGCAVSYFLSRENLHVAIIDKDSIASGGSGAAGAFIAPKISKAGELKDLLHDAFVYSLDFYKNFSPEFAITKPLLHIAKEQKEVEKLLEYKKTTTLKLLDDIDSIIKPHIVFAESMVLDARSTCEKLAQTSDFYRLEVDEIKYTGGIYHIGDLRAKNIVLATGAYPKIFHDSDYIAIRGIWGHRIEIEYEKELEYIMHEYISISNTLSTTLALGATHNVHYKLGDYYDIEQGRAELIEKAKKTIILDNINIIKDFTGLRSGSNDYMPILGRMVDSAKTLEKFPRLKNGQKVLFSDMIYHPNIYIINGSGGYGFVLAPYLAKIFRDFIVDKKELSNSLSPARFIDRYFKLNSQ